MGKAANCSSSAFLRPGEPCLVCGSTEHPIQQLKHEQPNKEDILKVEQQLAEAESAVERTQQIIAKSEAHENNLQQQLSDLEQKSWQRIYNWLNKKNTCNRL